MVTCVAKGCRNSNANGSKMCNFPKDPQRLRTWLANCGMENKKFNYCAALCEFHFTAGMWEKKRVDGSKKLKSSAVPTIFGELVTQQEHQKITNVPTVSTEIEEVISVFTVSANKEVKILQSKSEIARNPVTNISDKTTPNTQTRNFENYDPDTTSNEMLYEDDHVVTDETKGETEDESITSGNSEVIEQLQKKLQKSERLRFAMKKKHKRLQRKYRKKITKLQQEVGIQKHFSSALKNIYIQ
nr:PREDICTED: uncharacterized protein LOC105674038 [Linepithema humile]